MKISNIQQSAKGTQSTTPLQFRSLLDKEKYTLENELYKDNSESSSESRSKKYEYYKFRKETQNDHEQLKKFINKADQINKLSYKNLQKDRPSLPIANSTVNIYKSNKNVLEEIERRKDQQIKQTYLHHKKVQLKNIRNKASFTHKKKITQSKEIQTEIQENQIKKNKRYEKSKHTKDMSSIEQDKDEEQILQKKNRKRLLSHKNTPIYNTISLTSEAPKKWSNQNKGIKRYSIAKQEEQRTMFHEQKFKNQANQITNRTYVNFWEGQKINNENNLPQKLKANVKLEPITNELNKKTQISIIEKKMEKETSNKSLKVEQNGSIKYTEPNVQKQSHIYNVKPPSNNKQKEPKQQISIQFPEVSQLVVGANQPHNLQKIHPINIDFNEDDTQWIMNTYKPKSQFLRKIDVKNFQIKKYKNGVYFGEIQNQAKQGKGVIFYFNGRSYEGNFNKDMKEGKGFEFFPDGSVYKGDFFQGYKEGKGIFEWPNGQIYDGQWQRGKKNGSGMWKGNDGDSYIGQWKAGKVEGFGVFISKEGDRYEGQFKNSMKHGLGTERYVSGDTYVGLFSKNRPNGQGELYYKNGDYYKGDFSNGLRHGNGFLREDNGNSYMGEFRNDKRCGFGQYSTQEGEKYVGNFENDLKHGYGEIHGNGLTMAKGYWMSNKKVDSSMNYIQEKSITQKQHEVQKSKQKVKKKRKEPVQKNRKKSIEKEVSPDGNYQRACGCTRKH